MATDLQRSPEAFGVLLEWIRIDALRLGLINSPIRGPLEEVSGSHVRRNSSRIPHVFHSHRPQLCSDPPRRALWLGMSLKKENTYVVLVCGSRKPLIDDTNFSVPLRAMKNPLSPSTSCLSA